MAPPAPHVQAHAIQAPPLNQVAQAPQGSNGRALMMNAKQAQSSSDVMNEVVNGNFVIDSILRERVITLNKAKFRIDLIPKQMGSFDVIVGMDWLTLNRAEVVCFEKFLRILLNYGRIHNVFANKPNSMLNLMSCFQAQRYLRKKYVAFIALVVEKEHEEKKIYDIPVMRNFPNVFSDEVSGLPHVLQVEFRIDLAPRANPVAKAPYLLAPYEMQELLN
ncbi:uncharacterized protein LOC143582660 [Bidens hawaiensis]|uniref:uncharacterized protein LOC143582660 n=1 Tax=Bidens hawaiensis TaxID=980011 RepID=UPI004049254B